MGNSSGKPVNFADEVNLSHFRLLRVVGKGAFGKVRIVERKDTGLTFALKYIRKDEIVRSESVRNIIRERRMLEQLQHPFLCNLRYSFQDIEYLYMVIDLMQGGDLRFHITRKTFTEEAVRFWVAEVACALRYIHRKGIVHRDVKPDNILLDCEGHVHLADFNVASDFEPGKTLTSKSGTLAYLAPEAYEGRGYSTEVDWWSLGVVFYECIYNKRPFEGGNHQSLAARIVKARPTYPKTNPPVSAQCVHAISSLIEKNRRIRIGAVSFESFTNCPFFRELDFDALERKEIHPIFVPSTEKTNFDATYDLEELLLEEAPLEVRAKRQKPRSPLKEDATRHEIRADQLHRMIETMFLPYDYTRNATLDDARADLSLPVDADPSIIEHFTDRATGTPVVTPRQPHEFDYQSFNPPGSRGRHGAYSPSPETPIRSQSPADSIDDPAAYHSDPSAMHDYAMRPASNAPFPLPAEPSYTSHPNFPTDYHNTSHPKEHHLSKQHQQAVRGSWYMADMSSDIERGLDREKDRQMDREIIMELDMAEHNHSRLESPRAHKQIPRGGLAPPRSEGYVRGPTGAVHNAPSRFPLEKQHSQDRRQTPNGSRRSSPTRHAAYCRSDGDYHGHSLEVPRRSTTSRHGIPHEIFEEKKSSSSNGVLRFLDRKRGRDKSPKDEGGGAGGGGERLKEGKKGKGKERGVLGKEGARVIIANE